MLEKGPRRAGNEKPQVDRGSPSEATGSGRLQGGRRTPPLSAKQQNLQLAAPRFQDIFYGDFLSSSEKPPLAPAACSQSYRALPLLRAGATSQRQGLDGDWSYPRQARHPPRYPAPRPNRARR